MKVAFCAYGITWRELLRTEFYRQDYEILESLGHDVEFVSTPWRLGAGFDLAFVWWWNYLWMWGPVARARGLPILTTGVFDLAIDRTWPAWKRRLKYWGVRKSHSHLFISEHELATVPPILGLSAERVAYCPLAVDSTVYRPGSPPRLDGPLTLLNIAWQRLTNLRRKKVFELLEAFALLRGEHPDARLVLAGPPEDGLLALRERAAMLGVSDAVSFPGELSREEKIRHMQDCSLYCQVSEHEGFGLAIAEAMACGAPVLVSRRGAVPEVVGDCGAYVDTLTPRGIKEGFDLFLAARGARLALAEKGVARVRSRFSVERRRRDLRRLLAALQPARSAF
jgi:glycosyltransferase involved in cell wall biosynthesis